MRMTKYNTENSGTKVRKLNSNEKKDNTEGMGVSEWAILRFNMHLRVSCIHGICSSVVRSGLFTSRPGIGKQDFSNSACSLRSRQKREGKKFRMVMSSKAFLCPLPVRTWGGGQERTWLGQSVKSIVVSVFESVAFVGR